MSEFTIASFSVKEVRRENFLAVRKTVFLALCLQPPSNKSTMFSLDVKNAAASITEADKTRPFSEGGAKTRR